MPAYSAVFQKRVKMLEFNPAGNVMTDKCNPSKAYIMSRTDILKAAVVLGWNEPLSLQ